MAFILITAAFVTIIFKKFKQPVVLGYLLAGFFLGPHFPFFISVKDTQSIHIWAEIGVIFLLFGLGLEFSFKKLSQVGKSAGITAFIEAAAMLGLGYITGKFIGWNNIDSLYLGGILSISSTTIIVRAFDELGLKGKKFVNLVFGVLIVEDLIAILLLVLLTTVAVTNTLSGEALGIATLKLGFFLTIWFLVGIYIIPAFLNRVKKQLTNETTVVVALGLCLLMVVVATQVGFSAPLGAFIMGSILAETKEGKNIEHLLNPIKDLFSAVFFVSVGMLINPQSLYEYADIVIIITLVTITGKILSTSAGALLSGQSLKTSLYAGMSVAQIGEFSFIIATLGATLKVTSDFLYPIAVAVSAITTFTTPYLIKGSVNIYQYIDKKLPPHIKDQLTRYEATFNTKSEESVLSLLWEAFGIRILLNSTVIIAFALVAEHLILPIVLISFNDSIILRALSAILLIVFSAPFIWAVVFGSPANDSLSVTSDIERLKNLLLGVTVFRFIVGAVLVFILFSRFLDIQVAFITTLVISLLGTFFLKSLVEPLYMKIEERFMNNLNEKERAELAKRKEKPLLAPWDASMAEFTISPQSSIIGKTLQESELKEKFGVTIALIERGTKRIMAPGRATILMPYDHLYLIGNESELQSAKDVIEALNHNSTEEELCTYGLECIELTEHSPYINKSIRDCGLRENIEGLIVGIERDGQRTLNPDSGLILLPKDLVWVVADTKKLSQDLKSHAP